MGRANVAATSRESIIGAAYAEFAKIPEALILAFNAPSIRGLGATGGFTLQLQDPSSGDFNKFSAAAQEFVEKARKNPAVGAIGTSFRVSAPRIYAKVNRERAKALGVPISEVFDTMQAYFGNFYINDFIKFGQVFRVQTEAEAQYRSTPEDISRIYVRANGPQGLTMIPLDTVVKTEFTSGPDPVTHFNGYNTALVLGAAAHGFSSGQVLNALRRYEEGHPLLESTIEAAKLRFRPIVMTSMAFILGVVPLVIATGAGAASRNSIGTGVFGGMLAATFLAIFFVPLFFVLIRSLTHRLTEKTSPPSRNESDEPVTEQGYQHA